MGKQPDEPIRLEYVRSLHEGMNTHDAIWAVPELTARLIQNLEPFRIGIVRKRPGVLGRVLLLGDDGLGATVLDARESDGGDIMYGVDIIGSGPSNDAIRLRKWDRNTGEATVISPNGSDPPGDLMFVKGSVQGERVIYACSRQRGASDVDRVMSLWAWGSAAGAVQTNSTFQASMKPTVIGWFQNRLWAANNRATRNPAPTLLGFGGQTFESELWWSSLEDGLTWTDTNSLLVEPGRGGPITGLLAVRDDSPAMIIWKESLIALMRVRWGSSSALLPAASDDLDLLGTSIVVVTDQFGCVASGSVQEVPGARDGEIYFLAHDGVRAIVRSENDAITTLSDPVSLPIQEIIDRINQKAVHHACSGVHENRYYLSVPLDGAAKNTHTLVRDLRTGAWYVYDWPVASFVVARSADTKPNLWILSNVGHTETDIFYGTTALRTSMYRITDSTADFGGSAVATLLETRAFAHQTPSSLKRYHYLSMTVNSTNATPTFTVGYRRDNESSFTALGDLVYSKEGFSTRRINLADIQPAYWVQFQITSTDYSVSEIVDMTVAAEIADPVFDNSLR